MTDTKKPAQRTSGGESTAGWTDDEIAAMQERARELKAAKRPGKAKGDGEADVLAKIAEMPDSDRAMAERIHAMVKERAPILAPKTWYGMPAYAKDGKVVCFFKAASKFDSRYATLGFEETAALDDGTMWSTSWALTELTPADEARIGELIEKAAR